MEQGNSIIWLTVEEFRSRYKLGRNTVYSAIKANQIPHARVGRRILIPDDSLERVLDHLNGEVSGNSEYSSARLNKQEDANPG